MKKNWLPQILFTALILSGCGANGPFGLTPHSSGTIVVSDATTQQTLVTSQASPYLVPGTFSIGIYEAHNTSPFTLSYLTYTNLLEAPTLPIGPSTSPEYNKPCFGPSPTPTPAAPPVTNPQVYTLIPINAVPLPTPPITYLPANPCSAGEEEALQILDNQGHQTIFWYELTSTYWLATSSSSQSSSSSTLSTKSTSSKI